MNIEFAHPRYLWFLLIIIPCVVWYCFSWKNRYPTMAISSDSPFAGTKRSWKQYMLYVLFGVRMLLLATLIVIIARPQTRTKWSNTNTSGTDIVLALDVSSSMLAGDFDPDRLEASKKVASNFISGRTDDNIGLVIFAGEAFTAVPMTTDHAQLINYLNEVEVGILEDNTAIGDGLATSINRIKDGQAKSKSIILLTDGSHNAGQLTPMDAAEIARQNGIKVYTIGDLTGGKYFRATDDKVLANIFNEIDQLEKSEINVKRYAQTEEDFMPWAILALCLLIFELLGRTLVVRNIP